MLKTACYFANQKPVELTRRVTSSGEGEVWHTNQPGLLAKIYHQVDLQRSRKLAVMVAHPPRDPNRQIGHISFAWPQSILKDDRGQVVGFLMPIVDRSVDIMELYHPQRRRKVAHDLTWMHLHVIAGSLASLVWCIHEAGYVIGDMKPQNILVNAKTHPSIIDTDSFQVRNPINGELYRCPVGSDSFTPPELIGKDLNQVVQTPAQDNFRLGIILYLLLFGSHPFTGQWVGSGDSPPPNDLVKQGYWPYAPDSLIQPGLLTISLQVLHPALQACFLQCFNSGHLNPNLRPRPQDWVKAFRLAIADLKTCGRNKHHVYSRHHGHCHWCDRAHHLGMDVFPPPVSQQDVFKQEIQGMMQDAWSKTREQLPSLPHLAAPTMPNALSEAVSPLGFLPELEDLQLHFNNFRQHQLPLLWPLLRHPGIQVTLVAIALIVFWIMALNFQ